MPKKIDHVGQVTCPNCNKPFMYYLQKKNGKFYCPVENGCNKVTKDRLITRINNGKEETVLVPFINYKQLR